MKTASVIALGQRVSCGFYWAGAGIVVAIHGEQSPESIRQMGGGCVVAGGRATFDVAFLNGHMSRQVPEGIVHGVQWEVSDEIAVADEILDAVQFCRAKAAYDKEQQEATDERRAGERVRHAAEHPHLVKAKDKPQWSPGRVAAENIRRELKRAYPKVKFCVRSDYNSVGIKWTDGPTVAKVDEIAGKYEAGHFDGSDDCYKNDANATFADVFGAPKYVSASREFSEGTCEIIGRALCDAQRVEFAGANTLCVMGAGDCEWLSTHVWRVLGEADIEPGRKVVGVERDDRESRRWSYRVVTG